VDCHRAIGADMNGALASSWRALLAAFALAGAVPAAGQDPQPFSLAEVDFSPNCDPNAAFERLMVLLLPGSATGADSAQPAFDEPLYNAAAGAVMHVLDLEHEAPWHGLRLVGVRYYHGIESGPSNHSLVFADNPERVREVWNARGWNLPPAGETRVIEDEEILTAIGIEADGRGAAVTCFVD
jgi:hypothetical protein